MLILCATVSKAQRIVEVLPDDSFIVEINGKNYRAINADKTREIQKLRIDFDAAQKINTELEIQIKEALLQRDLAQAQKALIQQRADSFEKDFNRAREDSERWHNLFISERELRQEASQFVPHGSKTKLDKVLAFFDRPETVSFFKIGLPLIQTMRCQ